MDVLQGEFVNYGASRNRLLEYVDEDQSINFAFIADANDEIQVGSPFV